MSIKIEDHEKLDEVFLARKWLATKTVGGCAWGLPAHGWWLVLGGFWLGAGD